MTSNRVSLSVQLISITVTHIVNKVYVQLTATEDGAIELHFCLQRHISGSRCNLSAYVLELAHEAPEGKLFAETVQNTGCMELVAYTKRIR